MRKQEMQKLDNCHSNGGGSELPYLCNPRDIYGKFFNKKLGVNAVYKMFNETSFPRVVIGKKFFVTRPAFLEWWQARQEAGTTTEEQQAETN